MSFIADESTNALMSRAVSDTYFFPALPEGTRNRLRRQKTIRSYANSRIVLNSTLDFVPQTNCVDGNAVTSVSAVSVVELNATESFSARVLYEDSFCFFLQLFSWFVLPPFVEKVLGHKTHLNISCESKDGCLCTGCKRIDSFSSALLSKFGSSPLFSHSFSVLSMSS